MRDENPDELEPGGDEHEMDTSDDAQYDDEYQDEDAEYEDDPEPYKPPGFLEALRTSFTRPPARTASTRPQAQPASGTEADAKAVNYVDRRERLIAGFLGVFQLVLGFILYWQMRRLVVKPTKSPKVTAHQAHLDTLNYHHIAPYVLGVNLILGIAILGGVWAKRRSLVGFTVILAGLGLFAYGGGLIGIVYLGAGIWLIFRARKQRTGAGATATRAGTTRGAAATRATARAGGPSDADAKIEADRRALAAGAARTAAAVRKPPPPSKRYTPPSARRPAPPKVTPEPEKESRLTSWLRR